MRLTTTMINALSHSPAILADMLRDIPADLRKQHRRPGKWSIHEHTCHLAQADLMILERFRTFAREEHPVFTLYLPGTTVEDNLMDLDLEEQMASFTHSRATMVELLNSYSSNVWERSAEHPEYTQYSPYILLRHTLMHDHFHMYRIEELWLTRAEMLT